MMSSYDFVRLYDQREIEVGLNRSSHEPMLKSRAVSLADSRREAREMQSLREILHEGSHHQPWRSKLWCCENICSKAHGKDVHMTARSWERCGWQPARTQRPQSYHDKVDSAHNLNEAGNGFSPSLQIRAQACLELGLVWLWAQYPIRPTQPDLWNYKMRNGYFMPWGCSNLLCSHRKLIQPGLPIPYKLHLSISPNCSSMSMSSKTRKFCPLHCLWDSLCIVGTK